ncbi:hypothetical protein Hs20B_14020 [Lactococcus insecticola]|uniref:Sulfatase N-terminal domain-containing protein n=1 Tax=Pseudolactococcus insecticola TaxID=2709158 RepID=A0A6A0B9I4_9LACT|nr:hypothetical protein Hs20B_14020 [Lactococcus insecticola]
MKKIDITMCLKFGLMAGLVLYSVAKTGTPSNLLALIEILAVYVLGQILPQKIKILSYIISSVLYFLILMNMMVFTFSNSFTTLLMFDNIENVSALSTSLPLYISGIVLIAILALLPTRYGSIKTGYSRAISVTFIVLFYAAATLITRQTPLMAGVNLVENIRLKNQQMAKFRLSPAEKKKIYQKFEKTSFSDDYPETQKQPNVIVIFTEGLSAKVLDVNNNKDYNLTPNLDELASESIDFTNYFNHTAATYRGIRGQLYSAYQYQEGYEDGISDISKITDTKLQSLPMILGDNGYTSRFINAEPYQAVFSKYLSTLGFDKVISNKKKLVSSTHYLPDKDNYNLVFKTAKQLSKSSKPFFISTYTYETHVGLNTKVKYGDGSNEYLNKFHNMDASFGEFYKKFKNSDLAKNTILVFTTDHATYPDPEYVKLFDDPRDVFISQIPLLIKYPNAPGQRLDMKGRNSLDLAPTVLDMVGINSGKNYFLGTTLFGEQKSNLENLTYIAGVPSTTDDGDVKAIPVNSTLGKEALEYSKISFNN